MLAEENKNPGPSALDGKLEEMFVYPTSIISLLIASHSVSLKPFENVLYKDLPDIYHYAMFCVFVLNFRVTHTKLENDFT